MDEEDLLERFGEQYLRMRRHRWSAGLETVLDDSAFRLLSVISAEGPRTLHELSVELHLDQSTVNRQVNAAIRADLVERERVPGQVSKQIRMTPRGSRDYEHDLALFSASFTSAISELGSPTVRRLTDDLRRLNDALDRQSGD